MPDASPKNRRHVIALTLTLAALLNAGCAHQRELGAASEQERQTRPVNEWTGRLAVLVEDRPSQSYSAAFELRGSAQQGSLDLLSPLGSVVAQLAWQPGSAQLRNGGSAQQFASLDDLVLAATGTALPVATLFDWLKGQATPVAGWTVDLSRHAQGRYVAKRLSEPATELRVIVDQ